MPAARCELRENTHEEGNGTRRSTGIPLVPCGSSSLWPVPVSWPESSSRLCVASAVSSGTGERGRGWEGGGSDKREQEEEAGEGRKGRGLPLARTVRVARRKGRLGSHSLAASPSPAVAESGTRASHSQTFAHTAHRVGEQDGSVNATFFTNLSRSGSAPRSPPVPRVPATAAMSTAIVSSYCELGYRSSVNYRVSGVRCVRLSGGVSGLRGSRELAGCRQVTAHGFVCEEPESLSSPASFCCSDSDGMTGLRSVMRAVHVLQQQLLVVSLVPNLG